MKACTADRIIRWLKDSVYAVSANTSHRHQPLSSVCQWNWANMVANDSSYVSAYNLHTTLTACTVFGEVCTISFSGPKAWNALPDRLQAVQSTDSFKKQLKQLYLIARAIADFCLLCFRLLHLLKRCWPFFVQLALSKLPIIMAVIIIIIIITCIFVLVFVLVLEDQVIHCKNRRRLKV